MVAILGAAALAIGFAFKDYVNGLIAGLVAIFERPYRTGDWVKIDDAYGEVIAVGLRALRLVTPDDTVVTIPHSKIWDTNIYNCILYTMPLGCVRGYMMLLSPALTSISSGLLSSSCRSGRGIRITKSKPIQSTLGSNFNL